MSESPESSDQEKQPNTDSKRILKDFLKVFLVPVLINKMFMMYFGLNYSNYPGEGYGYGLLATFAFLFVTVGRFIWKYRDIDDP
jgi:hypothetical protein